MADAHPSTISGVFKRPYAEQVAFFRQKLRTLQPTAKWDDLWKSEHDKAFMVAGAAKADLLSDLAVAVERSITEGKSLEAFRKDFADIVQRHGWTDYTGDFGWRTRIILTTNANTSYAAGRLAQLREGGFDLWVYRHSDAVMHPRPQHLAWNGLTLPPDHPFWKTHYPPSGWGCQCYVLGTRDADGAKRLGSSQTSPPDGWDAIDTKTGEPVGIDKGWGYMPGATVADDVRLMAEKTVQWQYSLAKEYMQGLPDSLRDKLARSYRDLPSVADEARRYATRILEGRTDLDIPEYQTLGLLTEQDVARVKELGKLAVDGYDFALDPSGVGHTNKQHGDDASERRRGQRGVTADDYARLPRLINTATSVWYAGVSRYTKSHLMGYGGVVDGDRMTAIFEIRRRRRMLALETMYIQAAQP